MIVTNGHFEPILVLQYTQGGPMYEEAVRWNNRWRSPKQHTIPSGNIAKAILNIDNMQEQKKTCGKHAENMRKTCAKHVKIIQNQPKVYTLKYYFFSSTMLIIKLIPHKN